MSRIAASMLSLSTTHTRLTHPITLMKPHNSAASCWNQPSQTVALKSAQQQSQNITHKYLSLPRLLVTAPIQWKNRFNLVKNPKIKRKKKDVRFHKILYLCFFSALQQSDQIFCIQIFFKSVRFSKTSFFTYHHLFDHKRQQ